MDPLLLLQELSCDHHDPAVCDEDFSAQLMCAKSRVTPLSGLTIPRSELSGMVLSSRLTLTVAKALSVEESMHPTGSVTLSDSECSISALDKSSSALKPYFHNRVSEIKENTRALAEICVPEDVHHSSCVVFDFLLDNFYILPAYWLVPLTCFCPCKI